MDWFCWEIVTGKLHDMGKSLVSGEDFPNKTNPLTGGLNRPNMRPP